jgi:hypothetical protein
MPPQNIWQPLVQLNLNGYILGWFMTKNDDAKLIYEWKVPEEIRQQRKWEDIAETYRIYEHDNALGGCFVTAKFNGEWINNPFTSRHLIKHLVEKLGQGGKI